MFKGLAEAFGPGPDDQRHNRDVEQGMPDRQPGDAVENAQAVEPDHLADSRHQFRYAQNDEDQPDIGHRPSTLAPRQCDAGKHSQGNGNDGIDQGGADRDRKRAQGAGIVDRLAIPVGRPFGPYIEIPTAIEAVDDNDEDRQIQEDEDRGHPGEEDDPAPVPRLVICSRHHSGAPRRSLTRR